MTKFPVFYASWHEPISTANTCTAPARAEFFDELDSSQRSFHLRQVFAVFLRVRRACKPSKSLAVLPEPRGNAERIDLAVSSWQCARI